MEKACRKCLYADKEMYEEPCNTCNHEYSKFISNTTGEQRCSTCENLELDIDEEPCDSCEGFSNWSAPSEKTCENCKYCHTMYNQEPCASCIANSNFTSETTNIPKMEETKMTNTPRKTVNNLVRRRAENIVDIFLPAITSSTEARTSLYSSVVKKVWSDLYDMFDLVTCIDIDAMARATGYDNKLEYVEYAGLMSKIVELAERMYGNEE